MPVLEANIRTEGRIDSDGATKADRSIYCIKAG